MQATVHSDVQRNFGTRGGRFVLQAKFVGFSCFFKKATTWCKNALICQLVLLVVVHLNLLPRAGVLQTGCNLCVLAIVCQHDGASQGSVFYFEQQRFAFFFRKGVH